MFKGEEINFNYDGGNTHEITDDKINEKYLAGEVRIVTEQARYPLNTVKMMIESGNYELNPDFQRRHRWSIEKKSRLIESFIMNVPVPPIFLYENEYSHYEVMDGLQRLTAIYEFYSNKYELEGLEYWTELTGKTYANLPAQIKRGVDRRYLSSIILLQETAKDPGEAQNMKQLVFERINNGGIKLEGQETRNALYDGPMNRICIELSRDFNFCQMLDLPHENSLLIKSGIDNLLLQNPLFQKMTDVEYVLRFFAMRQVENGYEGRNLSEFFDLYLKNANLFEKTVLENLKILFLETMEFAYKLLGVKAFFLWRNRKDHWNWLNRATTTVYDPLTFVLSSLLSEKEILISKKEIIKEDLKKLYENKYEEFEGRNNNKSNIVRRISIFSNFFNKYLGD